ncbi:MBL fold metallo-hydrolase [uncultured Draconibacterium sp.]|uniref:MBL fold metallo-hydrolase n=1 Tax=uncultured Draconibacterium sp. TaxID=1573823 RepID=UPI0025D31673|nr:MBL fold metallo-hydrolase [uncultured Draconibacterium sp.]
MIKVEKFVVNPLGENTFVLSDASGECVIIDPGFFYGEEQEELKHYLESNGLNPLKIMNTHCHFDHIMGVEFVRKYYQIPFCAHPDDSFWVDRAVDQGKMFGFEMKSVSPIDEFIQEGETIKFGQSELEVIHVPGHAPGHVVFYSKEDKLLIAGDVLFYGSIGRTDLPGGNHEVLISNIKQKLFKLPDETTVYCGHGRETTLGFEQTNNPFLT